MVMTYNDLTLEFDADVAVLTLDRPDKLNSLTWAMHQEIKAALDEIEAGAVRAVLVTGAGRGFCAGQDLADLDLSRPEGIADTIEANYNPLVERLRGLPFPVVCAVNGVAAGAGANIALACDIVLAARSASFLQAFARIGLVPDSGGTWALTRRLGEARAKGLAMLAEPLLAETAESWGLIWKAVDDDQLMPDALALTRRLATQPTGALALIKQAVHAAATNTLPAQLALEAELQRIAAASEDFQEGVTAFMEKRKPVYKGR
jgi:2-(1,2-epoxy-1,2-dihydrophenyl)acetyl-CoA isomerase